MATVTRPTTPLPNPGDEIEAEQVRDWINNILSFIESTSIDEANVNLTATTGIVGKSTSQTITGVKTFTSTATGSGANTTSNFALNPSDSSIANNDGVRLGFQVRNSAGDVHDFGYLDVIATDTTATSEDGKFVFSVYKDGSAVEAFSIISTGPVFAGDITSYEDVNGADVTISIGTSAAESFNIIADNGSGKTLEQVIFESKTASGTADHGKLVFKVDEVTIASIEDDGIHATVGGVNIADDKTLAFGSDTNYTVEYDEDGTDKLIVSSAVDGTAFNMILQADRGDDAGDEWLLSIADGGILTLANDKASAGTHANGKLTLTASATASVLDFGGNATLYNDLNNADVSFAMGTSATESFNIITSNGASDKELYDVNFTTKTAESDADRGEFIFNVDEAKILTIDDGGIELESGMTISGLLSGTNLGLVYNNSNALATASTVLLDGTTLRVGTSGGSAGATFQVYGNTSGSYVSFSHSDDEVTFQKYGVVHYSNATNTPIVQIKNTYNDATAGTLKFINDRGAAGQDNDVCGTIDFFGDDDNQDNIRFAQIQGIVADASNGAEGGKLTLSVASHDGELNTGLFIVDGDDEDEIDATIGNGSASITTIAGTLTMGSTAAMTNAGLLSVGNQTGITGVGTITSGTWQSSTVIASAYLDTDTAHLSGSQTFTGDKTFTGTVTVGVDDTGKDVKFFGASAGAYMEWDESVDQLRIMGASADATTSTGKLLLATANPTIEANDVLGKIDFQAPHETGTDAITIAASIQAIAQDTFSASVNATDLIFYTGHSEAATEKLRITSQGEIGIGGANYGTDGQVLTSTGAGTAPAWEDAGGGGAALTGSTATTVTTVTGANAIQGETDLRWASQILSVDGASSTWDSHIGIQAHMCFIGHEDSHATNCEWTSNAYYNGAWKYIGSGEAARIRLQTGTLNTYHATSGSADASLSWVSNMYTGANGEWIWEATGSSAFVIATSTPKKPSGGDWSATSDSRLKTVTSNYTLGLDELCNANIRPVNYQYNGKGGTNADGKTYVGLVAQEVEQVFPNSVTQFSAKINDSDASETSDLRQFDGSEIKWALVNAVKELKTELDAAKARIATLEAA